MALKLTPVDQLPPGGPGVRSRQSESAVIYEQLLASSSGILRVHGDTPAEALRFYRSLHQWRVRHDLRHKVTIQKWGDCIFLALNDGPGLPIKNPKK